MQILIFNEHSVRTSGKISHIDAAFSEFVRNSKRETSNDHDCSSRDRQDLSVPCRRTCGPHRRSQNYTNPGSSFAGSPVDKCVRRKLVSRGRNPRSRSGSQALGCTLNVSGRIGSARVEWIVKFLPSRVPIVRSVSKVRSVPPIRSVHRVRWLRFRGLFLWPEDRPAEALGEGFERDPAKV